MSYETIAESNESTVVAEFHSNNEKKSAYESEKELERAFIALLQKQGYEFKEIHKEQDLKDNLKEQLEKLNDHYFTPKEWDALYSQFIANKNDDYKAKTRKIQEDPIFNLTLESGKTKNIKIIDKKNIHKNALQVIHQYTIIDAIRDKNVLPFRVEYHNTIKAKEDIKDNKVRAVDEQNALLDTRRIKEIAKCILERFNQATKNKKFNSILACSSIEALKKYYQAFKEEKHDLKIATIFSYGANEELDALEDENNESACRLDKSSRDFLEGAIMDYNGMFGTSFDTTDQKFQSYYKDLSQKMKNREIDLLMVVNMFLTGFDATRLNTLWVDKNLKYHGLIQAFSRANRILDSVKTHGNIVCFRDLEQDLNDALMLFGDKDAKSIALLRKYEDYLKGYTDNNKEYEGYEGLIGRLLTEFPLKEPIISESQKKDFIKLFGKILKLENILNSFENFKKDDYINPRDFQDYQSKYLDFYDGMRPEKGRDKEEINDDLIFEIELIKQVEVNIDYILNLIEEFAKEHGVEIQGVKTKIEPIINSSIELRNKKDLIMDFIDKLMDFL
ncbi:hypothetical protein MM0358_02680 [Helicobacter pylori]